MQLPAGCFSAPVEPPRSPAFATNNQVGYFMYYYESWVLPALMRQEKMQYK
jgi:hypothetical protein